MSGDDSTQQLIERWRDGTITGRGVKILFDEESHDFVEGVTHVERCPTKLDHTQNGVEVQSLRCVRPASHHQHDLPHLDRHGCKAKLLVSAATLREVQAIAAQRQRDEEQRVFDRAYIYAGDLLSFDIAPNGDVMMLVGVPSDGSREQVIIKASELAGMAEASKNKREGL